MSSFDQASFDRSWPRGALAALALLASLTLAGCGEPPRPFAHTGDVNSPLLKLADPAGIALMELGDFPASGQKRFQEALIDQLHRAEVPATVGGGNAQSFRLAGQAIDRPAEGGHEVLIHWRMTDAAGQPRGNHVVRRVVDPKAWQAGDPELMRDLARSSSAGIVSLLPDRNQALAAATPQRRANQQPSSIVPPMGTRLAASPRPPQRPQVAQATPGPSVTEKAATEKAAADNAGSEAKDNGAEQPPVALRPIEGAPGDGDESLRKAMQYFLGRNSITVVSEYDAPAAIVAGEVFVRPIGSKQQDVRVDWTVYAPDGRRLGTVGQSNRIPAGQLDGKWGDIAFAVAEGAVQGLSELFEQIEGFSPQKQLQTQPKKK